MLALVFLAAGVRPLLRKEGPALVATAADTSAATAADSWAGLDLETSPNSAEDFHGDQHTNLSWTYRNTSEQDGKKVWGPQDWFEMPHCEACKEVGTQSPIDYPSFDDAEPDADLSDLELNKGDCHVMELEVNAHTTEVVYHDCGVEPHVRWQGEDYRLVQFHFHSPSEHSVNGTFYPMETHLVHKNMHGQALVLAVFVEAGDENTFFSKFWPNLNGLVHAEANATETEAADAEEPADAVAEEPADAEETEGALLQKKKRKTRKHAPAPADHGYASLLKPGLNFHSREVHEEQVGGMHAYRDFVPKGDYLHYMGSFTTPPCTADTVWISYVKPVTASAEQIDAYRATINNNADNQLVNMSVLNAGLDANNYTYALGMGANNRPIQSLVGETNEHRKVYKYHLPTEAEKAAEKSAAVAVGMLLFASIF